MPYRRLPRSTAAALTLLALASPVRAEIALVGEPGDDAFALALGGYFRAFNGAQFLELDAPGIDDETGINSTVARAEWRVAVGDAARLEIHERFAWLSTTGSAAFAGAGVGVTPAPNRTVDLATTWQIGDDGATVLEHDLDRAVLRLFIGPFDASIGRQAITWGTANLFTVTDVWAAFSPYDLDTSQKRGVDAVRAVVALGSRGELDLVIADRGELVQLSGGARATWYLGFGDIYAVGGHFWDRLAVAAGVSAEAGELKLRAEAFAPYDPADGALDLPRATAGVDWFATGDFSLTVEGHFNGDGGDDPDDYAGHAATSEPFDRGEVFLLGRWYAGAAALWRPYPTVSTTLGATTNLVDPSALATWAIAYEIAQDVEASIGGFHGFGDGITFDPLPRVRSEYGSYGHLAWLQLAAFF